jgi:hypothetical protein
MTKYSPSSDLNPPKLRIQRVKVILRPRRRIKRPIPPIPSKLSALHLRIHRPGRITQLLTSLSKNIRLLFSQSDGILQLSVVAFMPSGEHLGEFNKYIEHPSGAVISSNSTVIHGLSMNDPRIQSAQSIEQVWSQFISFCESFLTEEQKRDVFIVWGGKQCDFEWIIKITEEVYADKLVMLRWCPYLMDPKMVISSYKSCHLQQSHSKVTGYGLEAVWCHLTQETALPDAHDSLVDSNAKRLL